jgi:DNA-directed RNA polymerase beta' subunit
LIKVENNGLEGVTGKKATNTAVISESIPNIKGTQVGLRNPTQIDSIKHDMINEIYDFKKIDNIIAGYVDSKGNYYVTEGHHRMVAAMEIYKETGNASYVKKLLSNGKWTEIKKPPIDARPLPKR